MKSYEKYKKDLKEVKKRLKEKEEMNLKRNMEDYYSYQRDRRSSSSFSISRSHTKKLEGAEKKEGALSGKRRMLSVTNFNLKNKADDQQGKEIDYKLDEYNRRMQRSHERRRKHLRNVVKPIKQHHSHIK